MITVTKDGELMTNYSTINPVPAGEVFGVFTDHTNQPAVMSLSEDNILYLIISNNGKVTRFNFGKSSGVVGEGRKVLAFAVQQAPDGTLDICMAVNQPTDSCHFYLLHAIKPEGLLHPIPLDKIINSVDFPIVKHIYMGNKSTAISRSLPLVMIAFNRPDRLTKTEDLNFVKFNGKKAERNGCWNTHANPKEILAVELGTCNMGDGALILYKGHSGNSHLLFQTFPSPEENEEKFSVEPVCPKGAVGLSSFLDPQTRTTNMLVAGTAISCFHPKDYLSPKGTGKVIDTLEKVPGLKDIHCSQTRGHLRLWYTTVQNAVYYYTTTTADLTEGLSIPLIPEGQGGRVSGLLCSQARDEKRDLLVSSLLSVDQDANICLLQQDSASKVWQKYPFFVSSEKDVREVQSYMLRFRVIQKKGSEELNDGDERDMILGSSLYVTCSGLVRCFINGKAMTISPTGGWYQTDAKGVLNILLQTEDATCHQFAAQRYRPAEVPGEKPPRNSERVIADPMLDPSEKVIGRLKNIKTEADLRGLCRQDGTPLVGPDVADGDVCRAAKAFQQLSDRAGEIHLDKYSKRRVYEMAILELNGQPASGVIAPCGLLDDAGDWLVGAWNWVSEKAQDAIDWGLTLVGDVWKFIVKIGEGIFEIALTTITSIIKGIVWVFKKIGALIKDIIEALGFLFGWGDILDTTDSIVAGFNATLDHGKTMLDSAEGTVHDWLETMGRTLKQQLPMLQEYEYERGLENMALGKVLSGSKQTDRDEVKDSVAYNWSAYNFTYGGGTSNVVLVDNVSKYAFGVDDELLELWDTAIEQLGAMTNTVVKLADEFIAIFQSGKLNIRTLISKLGTILIDELVNALKGLADIIFRAVSAGISIAKDLGNAKIEIPIISWVWENLIAKGRPLTLLNFCGLLVAIPTTVLYKAINKSAPPKLSSRVNKDTFAQHVTSKGNPNLSKDINNFTLCSKSGLGLVSEEFSTLGLLADGTFEGLGLSGIPSGFINNFMDIFDSVSLTFEVVGGFVEWPIVPDGPRAECPSDFDLATFNKYSGLAMKAVDMGSDVIIKVVAKSKKAPRPVVKRWKATVGAVTSVPKLCLSISNGIQDNQEGKKNNLLVINEFLEAALEFGKQWGESVAVWNSEIQNPVMYAGLFVKQVCAYTIYGLEVVDFGMGMIE